MDDNIEIKSKDVISGAGTYKELVYSIAKYLVENNVDGNRFDNEEQKRIRIEEKEQELQMKISSICNTIVANHPEVSVTEGFQYSIAKTMLQRIERGASIESFNDTNDVAEDLYLNTIKQSEKKQANPNLAGITGVVSVVIADDLISKFNQELEKIGEKVEIKNDTKIVTRIDSASNKEYKVFVEKPIDSKYECKSEEEEIHEGQIEARKYNIKDIVKKAMLSKDESGFVERIQSISSLEDGLGTDALLRAFDELLIEYDSQILDSSIGNKLMDILDFELKSSKMAEDKYTESTKISILTSAITMSENFPKLQQLEEKLKQIDPGLFSLIKSNPTLFKYIQSEFLENNESILSEIRQSTKGDSKTDFLEAIKDFASRPVDFIKENGINLTDEQFIKLDEAQKGIIPSMEQTSETIISENIEDTPRENPSITVNDDKFKQNIAKLVSDPVRGMNAIPTILASNADDEKKDYILNAILESLNTDEVKSNKDSSFKEKKVEFFKAIVEIQRTNGEEIDQELINRLAFIDFDSLRKVVDYYLEIRNKGISKDISITVTYKAIENALANASKEERISMEKTTQSKESTGDNSRVFNTDTGMKAFLESPKKPKKPIEFGEIE